MVLEPIVEPVVLAQNLTKQYGDHLVVKGIDLKINRDICYGLLGPNGAGKSTTMKMIYGSCQVTKGALSVLGLNAIDEMKKIKKRIGVVPQEDGLDPDFSVLDNLLVYSRYHRISNKEARKKAAELLDLLHLSEFSSRSVESLSGGMKRRLAIARGLLNDPEFLILDEPTTGLDPQARHWVWSFISDLKRKGVTVLLSTHYMDEAESLCDFITVIDHGKILDQGNPKELIQKHVGNEVMEFVVENSEVAACKDIIIKERLNYKQVRNKIQIYISDNMNQQHLINQIKPPTFSIRKATLEDVFLKLSGSELRDE